ncbi:MAG TPA: mechanosensitive ion channel family protein [Candidatus Binataceae bacterium]|nr:mechanosensitive ion channel family protein [Candidatus Binataceae bacterium]
MSELTQLQSLFGFDGLPVDTRAVIESTVAVAALLYAMALRHRKGNLQAWPVAMAGVGLVVDVATPLFGRARFAYLADTAAVILFLWGVIRIGLELADAASHRGREHFSTIFRDLLTLTLWSLVVMIVLRTFFRIDVSALLAVPAVLTVVVGFALQETLGNIFSGLTLQISRPFEPGDWVRVADKVGRVHDVGWRATTIVTRANEWLDIPNAQLAKDLLFNYGNHAVAEEVSIGLGYGEPPNRVREIILDLLRDVPDVLRHPEPEILAWEFGDYAIRYRVKYWLADYGRSEQIHARVVSGLWYALRRHGIEIPFPVRTLVLSQERRVEESEALREIVAELRGVDFLRELSDDEMRILASAVRVRQFGVGEALVREGESGDTFYIIRRGVVDVTANGADGQPIHLNELTRPAFFGEMALMTGESRNATIRARTDVEILEMNRGGFTELFKSHPDAAAQMSEIIAARLSQRRELLDAGHPADGGARGRSSRLLAKMREIFDI